MKYTSMTANHLLSGRSMSWITYCGHTFGGTVFSYFWVAGDVTSPWVWLDHDDRSLSSRLTTELQKASWPRRRELFPSALSNVNEFNANSPAQAWHSVRIPSSLNWAVRPMLWRIGLSPPSALNRWQYIMSLGPPAFLAAAAVFLLGVGKKTSKMSWLWRLG